MLTNQPRAVKQQSNLRGGRPRRTYGLKPPQQRAAAAQGLSPPSAARRQARDARQAPHAALGRVRNENHTFQTSDVTLANSSWCCGATNLGLRGAVGGLSSCYQY